MSQVNIFKSCDGESVSYNTKYGAEIYRRSLTVLLQCAISEVFPDLNVQIGQSLMKGYYFEPVEGPLPDGFKEKTEQRMNDIVAENVRFTKVQLSKEKAIELYSEKGRSDKVDAIRYLPGPGIELVYLRDYFDYILAECVFSTGYLKSFRIIRYGEGFILQHPSRSHMGRLPGDADRQEKLFQVYLEGREWGRILGIKHVPDLNRAIEDGSINTLIRVQEAFHEKKIAYIADRIKEYYPRKRFIYVAGPSASGKTTFLKRLGIQLKANGLNPEEISLDNYFLPRAETPRTPDGEIDYECLEALDTGFFSEQLRELDRGKDILLPKYDFKTGERVSSGKTMGLKDNSVMLIEGIHGLNPVLAEGIPPENRYGVFVSSLTQLYIDNDTRVFTSDTRLMRRLVRDTRFRGAKPWEIIKRFPKVREGEDRYIFPFQDSADVFFNSSLIYEQAVLKPLIVPMLEKIKKKNDEFYEAHRLYNYLEFFMSASEKVVPQVSILREFIGNSGFTY